MSAKKKAAPRAARAFRPPFSEPGPRPKLPCSLADEAERARWQNDRYDWELRSVIYQATFFNDPDARERLASMLIMTLALDLPLRKPALEYLRWMLIELREKDAIPNVASRGNAVKTREYVAQIRRLVEVLHSIPKGTVIQRLEGAAKVMNCSYQKVRGMYYSDTFRAYDAISKKSSPH